ncbi:hypothetical protein GCM10023189_27590 [Nibrella saemangeumensis]|uniref:Uncharacterized protein n=1 Tax=Nibrella saemangeumensis TaxID=1084526 RepID=A0ABP8MWH8_9BACT
MKTNTRKGDKYFPIIDLASFGQSTPENIEVTMTAEGDNAQIYEEFIP